MKKTILCLSLIALSFTACKNEAKTDENKEEKVQVEEKEENTENLPLAFTSEKQYEIARLYLDLKEALTNEDSYASKKISEIIVIKFNDTKEEENKKIAQTIVDNEENIEAQREAFYQLSTNLAPAFEKNITGGKLYKQYCPMAFDGKGAFWFSSEKEIMNPYFGDKMLKCGEVQDIIK
ncbi:Protein of unknown function [Mesonia phycicola]|uniref:DUF3347 domain-containing protein n=1 Tax=Mesonia phycicola TaxID=579105 RepID=A0A1M6FMU8_9FLAO|nr:DUF3347 domain-containing protein [Mesonia phycicola]SHI99078.1 Protein of unknown function [Mesonia phycicola]